MLKKTITYKDHNGLTRSEDFYFSLSPAQVTRLELEHEGRGGLAASMQAMIDAKDGLSVMNEVEKIILMSYGEKSEDGRRFTTNKQMQDEFKFSAAYDALFMELVMDAEKTAEFVRGIVPAELIEIAEKLPDVPAPPSDEQVPDGSYGNARKVYTRAEVEEMSVEEFMQFKTKMIAGEAHIEEA